MIIKSDRKLAYLILLVFGVIYSSISLVNHYNFRTYALDLGLYNNALYDYAHFRINNYSLLKELFHNPLGDHFALITPLVSPLYWIFGSYTMIILQIAGVLFGGYGIYIYFSSRTEKKYIPEIAMVHFFSIWGIYSALSFDFHDNVLAAMFVPWLLHYFDKGKWKPAALFLALILISKENMALWAFFICIGLALLYLKDKVKRNSALIGAAVSICYFIVAVKFIIPYINGGNSADAYYHFKYAALGNNFSEAFQTIITSPVHSFKLLFINHLGDPVADGIKKELHWMVLLSGGFVLLWRPQYLVMLIPIYAQKLYSDDFMKWGINGQYSIEFVPILTIALFSWVSSLRSYLLTMILGSNFVLLSGYSTFYKLEFRISKWYNPVTSQFYSADHYKTEYDVKKVYEALKMIPDDANVSAQSPLVPHLSFRKVIYQFPVIDDAEYIVLLNKENIYPLSQEEMDKKIEELSSSPEWQCIYKENFLWIFKRKQSL